jgi:hypothetical protein
VIICLLLAVCANLCAQSRAVSAEPTATIPSDTDSRIADFNDPHFSWPGKPTGQLLVFLPGTGGRPNENSGFAETASRLGFHVISLMYPDNIASQKRCSNSPDPDSYIKFRMAIIHGGEIGPHRTISPADSIESRLAHLLGYLNTKQPEQNWGQFIATNGAIQWDKIVISGSSQGGGHAFMISKYHKVARVIMFASPKDYSFHFDAPAKGFDTDTQTPRNRYFAFNHMRDDGNGCTHDQQSKILTQMGLPTLGIADADTQAPKYNNAHLLYSNEDVAGDKFHGSVSKGFLKCCVPVWTYMLTAPVQ